MSGRSARTSLNRALKRWPSWVVLVLVVVAFLTIGATRGSGPRTDAERIDAISKRLACPTCDGESVFESQASASRNLRNTIEERVREGTSTDNEIVAYIEERFGASVLLVPKATGLDALVWALPAAAFVCAVAGLGVAFVRWRRRDELAPSDEDRALVAVALRAEDR
jgi:cytochrome c-type biogenesis protein CcmH